MVERIPKDKEEILHIIKHVETDPTVSQRLLSNRLNISLGKTNYLLKELIKKGFINAHDFSRNSGKLRKLNYLLTKEGLEEKLRLSYYFLKTKEAEYNIMKKEWEQLMKDKSKNYKERKPL